VSAVTVTIPDEAMERLEKLHADGLHFGYASVDEVLRRPEIWFKGRSPLKWIADGDGSWPDLLRRYETLSAWLASNAAIHPRQLTPRRAGSTP